MFTSFKKKDSLLFVPFPSTEWNNTNTVFSLSNAIPKYTTLSVEQPSFILTLNIIRTSETFYTNK